MEGDVELVDDRADVIWDVTDNFEMLLPDEDFFSAIDFIKGRGEEVRKVETNERRAAPVLSKA